MPQPSDDSNPTQIRSLSKRAEPWVLMLACLLPTLVTYAYFHLADGAPAAVQQTVYGAGKLVQFALPVVWVGLCLRHRLGFVRWTKRGLALGVGFGGLAGGCGLGIYHAWLRHTPPIAAATEPILAKVDGLGIRDPWVFIGVGVFYALIHSLLEEYYWRWFVFRRLRGWVNLPIAIGLSSAGFMAHHILVLDRYFHEAPWLTALLSLSVMIGGAFWAWLYERSGSLLAPWLSHLIIDAAIFAIGYSIITGGG